MERSETDNRHVGRRASRHVVKIQAPSKEKRKSPSSKTGTMTKQNDVDDSNKTVITLKGSVSIVSDFFFTAINSILYQRGKLSRAGKKVLFLFVWRFCDGAFVRHEYFLSA